jgi:serine/threonine protein kinase
MQTVRAVNTEPIPGYRLLEPLGSGGFGEVWKCEAPGGLFKAIKFVTGHSDHLSDNNDGAARELQALQHIKTIRHPYLLAMDRVEMIDGDLVIVMELADKSLQQLLEQYRQIGLPGIPRDELLGYLRETAEVLDLMNQDHGLQHLDIKPRNLFLLGQHVKVADFGLVSSLGGLPDCHADDHSRNAITPLYAPPETFLGKISVFSDQYSLAITYCELLTGTLPFTGKNFRQVALAHVQGKPELSALPSEEAAIVRRALAKGPTARFPSCTDFLLALEAVGPAPVLPPPRPRNTKFDICLGEMTNTAVVPAVTAQLAVTVDKTNIPRVTPGASPTPTGNTAAVPDSPPARIGREPAPAGGPGGSLVPGHQLLECIGRLPVGEVWLAGNTEGQRRTIKLVAPPEPIDGDPENDPVAVLQRLQHPILAPLEVIACPGKRVALVTAPGDGSLHDRMKECHRDSLPGIPRMEALNYLKAVAEGLDALQTTYRLQHLCLTPKHVLLQEGQPRLVDFGLMELFWAALGFEAPALNTRYCAPELFSWQSSRECDQYSLALIYQEVLTGVHPFRNLNQRQMATVRLRGSPDVGLLPAIDRPIIMRALHLDPDQRFRTSSELIAALEAVSYEIGCPPAVATRAPGGTMPSSQPPYSQGPRPAPGWPQSSGAPAVGAAAASHLKYLGPDPRAAKLNDIRAVIAAEVAAAAGNAEVRSAGALRYTLHPPQPGKGRGEPFLEAHCFGRLLPATVRLKLAGFREQWQAELIAADKPAELPGRGPGVGFAFFVRVSASIWQRCIGRQPGIEVNLTLHPPLNATESLTEVCVHLLPQGLGAAERAQAILCDIGPTILESLKNYLQLHTERRVDPRFPYPRPIQVYPVLPAHDVGAPFLAQGKDISAGGMGLSLPCEPPTPSLLVQIDPGNRAPVVVPAYIVRAQPTADGRLDVGLRFDWDAIA